MIGVAAKPGQEAVVAEFFEFFKTPWEFYCPGCAYDVLLVTADQVPTAGAALVLAYGSGAKSTDLPGKAPAPAQAKQIRTNDGSRTVPVYTGLATFSGREGVACLSNGREALGIRSGSNFIRVGYDLFDEVKFLLSTGQPVEDANVPSLDLHIGLLREWILESGIPLLEIPAVPAGFRFTVCLTHDIDFVGIRLHRFDHTMWGFLYRSTIGAVVKLLRGRISFGTLLRAWRAAASLPFVYLGWARDFWEPFQWYLDVEKGLNATYFLIPFKGRAGERVPGKNASRRAAAYEVDDLSDSVARLKQAGCELAVHGIDAWHSVAKGREEKARIERVNGAGCSGIRMHWLLRDDRTFPILEQSGYAYDSTVGYNETIGYRAGTGQVFRPLGTQKLLELPVHIQDGALFYPNRMDLSESEAGKRCRALLQDFAQAGGVLTIIWHDRSHAAERFWGAPYVRLVEQLKAAHPWFASAEMAVGWFRKRRAVTFERSADGRGVIVKGNAGAQAALPPLNVRVYRPARDTSAQPAAPGFADTGWSGESMIELNCTLNLVVEPSAQVLGF